MEANEIGEIAEYINGYPPAAYFAINQCLEYGKELLISDKHKLVKFSNQRFLKHIEESGITDIQKNILSLLSTYSPLPLIALAKYCENNEEKIHDSIYQLIDKALVVVDSNALYRIAEPISNAARNLFGFPAANKLKELLPLLKGYAEKLDNRRKLDVSRILFRIGAILKDEEYKESGIHLRNDFIQLVQTSYHNRNYKEAIEFGYSAVKECPDNSDAREFLIRALIQNENWEAAESQLDELKKYTELRDVYFLFGFLYRKKGDSAKAVSNFLESEKVGRRGGAIKRELAHSYLLMNEIDEAVRYIKEALRLQSDNSHVVDMAVKIYMKASMEEEAKQALTRLELIDNYEYFLLRKSTFEYTFGYFDKAEVSALEAVEQGGRSFFAAKVQLVRSYIKNKKFTLANELLNTIDKDFHGKRNDVRIALRCSLLITENKFKDALQCAERFLDKSCFQYRIAKVKALTGLIDNVTIPYEDRKKYKKQLKNLQVRTTTDIDVLGEIEL